MRNRRLALMLSILLILSTALTGCMARPNQGNVAAAAGADALVVDIPAIAVTFDDQGQASLKGLDLSALGVSLDALARTPEQIGAVSSAGVKAAYVDLSPTGVNIYADGKPMLTLDWDADTIQSLGAVLGIAGIDNADTLAKVLPLLSNMSLGVAMNFPGAGDNPTLVGPAPDKAAILAANQAAAGTILGELGVPPFATALLGSLGPLTIRYDASGTATLDGLGMIAGFLPADALAGLNLKPDQLSQVKELGIQNLNVQTKPEGLAVTLNGNALPMLRWDSGQMDNLVKLGLQGGVLTAVTGADAESLDALNQVGKFAPLLATTPLNITVSFPE